MICIDARMAFHSGIGTYIRSLLPHMQKAFPSMRVLAPPSMIEKWPQLEQLNWISIDAPIYSIEEQWKVPLRLESCDLFWSPHYNISLLPIRAKKRLVTIHDVYHFAFRHTLGIRKKIYANLVMRAAVRYADHIVTVSQFSYEELVRWLKASPSKISVISNGLNHDLFSFPSSKLSAVRSLYKLPENYFIFVSTQAPHKNLMKLMQAWSLIAKKHPDWHLVLVGKESHHWPFRNVRQLGWVPEDDLPALYQEAQGLIYPSTYEGFGLPPLEAMAMRCPTIVSSVASLPEVCGEASLYVDPVSEDDIAQKICLLIEKPLIRQTLIEKGRQRVEQFNWEKSAQSHIELIHRML